MTRSGTWACVVLASFAWFLPAEARTAFAVDRSEVAPAPCIDTGPASVRDHAVDADAYYLESEHFVVSYFTSGLDSIWSPDLPTNLLEDLEYARRVLSSDPRSAMHVPFGTYDAGGGVRKILVRIEKIATGYSGFAHWEWPSSSGSAPCSTSADGSIRVSRRVRDRVETRLVATHELMHLFQYAMDPFEPSWLLESTAQWATGFVFPQYKAIGYSFASLVFHRTSLWNTRQSKIYSPHFWDFLDLALGESIAPKMWARICTLDWNEALRQTLAEHGVDFDRMLHEYAVWNYYTGKRRDGNHYPYAELPEIEPDALFTTYPVVDDSLNGKYAEEAGSNYIFFAGAATRENLRVRLHGTPAWMEHRKVTWIGTTRPNTHAEFTPDDPASEEFVVPHWYQYDQVAVIVTNGVNGNTLPPADLRYTVMALEEGGPVVDLAWQEGPEPLRVTNPSRGGAAIRYRSTGMARRTQVVIYDARGRLVKRLVDRALPAGDFCAYWDGTKQTGNQAAAGVYMLVLRHDGGTFPSRFIFLR